MTRQYPDFCVYQDIAWQIKGITEELLSKPSDFSMETRPPSSACWRGYIRVFSCRDDQLFLDTLFVETDDPKLINGKPPYLGTIDNSSAPVDDLPKLSGGQPIVADFREGKVRFSHDIHGMIIGGFSCIYTELDLFTSFTGSLILENAVSSIQSHLLFMRSTYITYESEYAIPDEEQIELLRKTISKIDLLTDKVQRIFDAHESITDEFLTKLEDQFDSSAFNLDFEKGALVNHTGLTIREMIENLEQMRRMGMDEYEKMDEYV